MHYRRLSYRYALLLTSNQSHHFAGLLEAEQSGVRFAQTYWRPPADVCECDSTIEVTVDLAGIDQDDLDVVLFEDALIVEAAEDAPVMVAEASVGAATSPPASTRTDIVSSDVVALLSAVTVGRREDGGVRLEAPPHAARALMSLRNLSTRLRQRVFEIYEGRGATADAEVLGSTVTAVDVMGLMLTSLGGSRIRGAPWGKRSGCAS